MGLWRGIPPRGRLPQQSRGQVGRLTVPAQAMPFLLTCTCAYWALCLVCSSHLSQPSHFLSAFKPQFKSQFPNHLHPRPGDILQIPRTFHKLCTSTWCARELFIHPAAVLKLWLPQGRGCISLISVAGLWRRSVDRMPWADHIVPGAVRGYVEMRPMPFCMRSSVVNGSQLEMEGA